MSEVKLRLAVEQGQFVSAMGQASAALGGLQTSGERAAVASEKLSGALARVGHYAVAGLGISQLTGGAVRLADEFANLNGRLMLVSDSSSAAAATQARLFAIAQETRSGMSGLSEVFVKLSQSTQGSGVSQERLLNITRTTGQAMALSGGSAESMNAALMQLGQGMSAGALRGEELNSVIEQTPALAKAIAEGMGRTVGELKDLGEAGKITSTAIVQALEASAKKVESDFTKLPLTVEGAINQMRNSLLQSVGVFDRANGLSTGLAQSISTLSQNMGVLAAGGGALASVLGGRLAGSMKDAVVGSLAQRAATLAQAGASAAAAEAHVAQTAAALAAARADVLRAGVMGATTTAERVATAAALAHTEALMAQAGAQAALARAGIGATALAALGGPIGALTLALGLGATAWMLWGNSSADAAKKSAAAVLNSGAEVLDQLDKENRALELKIKLLRGSSMNVANLSPAEERKVELLKQLNALSVQQAANENDERLRRSQMIGVSLELVRVDNSLATSSRLKSEAARAGGEWDERLVDIRMRLGGVNKDYVKSLQDLAGAANADAARAPEYVALMRQLAAAERERGDAAKKSAAEQRAGASAYKSLHEELSKTLAQQAARAAAGGELTAAQQMELTLTEKLAEVHSKLTPARTKELQAMIGQAVAGQRLADSQAAQAEALKEFERVRLADAKAMASQAASGEQQLQSLQDQYIELTAGKEVLQALVLLRMEDAAATHDQMAAMLYMDGATDQAVKHQRVLAEQLRKQIDWRKKIAAATDTAEADKANAKAAQDAAAEWQRASDQIGQALTDALMTGGKSAAEYIKGLFRTMVLKPVLQAAVQPIAGALTTAMGFAQPAAEAGKAAGGFGDLASMTGMAASFGTFGTTLGMGASATMAGSSAAAFSGASSMIGAGNVAGGLGMGVGAAMPYIAAAMAIYAIADHLDKSGTPHMGSVVSGSGTDLRTLMGDRSTITDNLNQDTDQALRALIQSSTGILSALGGGEYSATARYAADNTDPSIGQFTLAKGGAQVGFVGAANSGSATGEGSDYTRYNRDAATGLKEFTADVVQLTRAELDKLNLPEWAQTQLDKLGQDADLSQLASVASAIEATTAEIGKMRDALSPLGGVFTQFAGLTSDAVFELATAFGGSGALAQTAAGYYQTYHTAAERAADTTQQITAALATVGVQMPATRDAFRALVEAQDLSTDSGRKTFAALMQVSGAFAELTPELAATASGALSAADALRQKQSLELELLRLQGDTAELRRRELAALDPGNVALQQQIYAINDQAAAAQLASQAMAAASDSARQYLDTFNGVMGGLVDSRFDLENQLLELNGKSAEVAVRTRERDLAQMTAGLTDVDAAAAVAAYDYNAALREQVNRLQGAQQSYSSMASTAVQAADTVRDAMAGVWDGIADEIRRLRGLTKTGPESLTDVSAQFAIATAQARSGDAEAAKRLPALSRQLDDLAQASASSASQLRVMRGRTAASLETTLGATGGDAAIADLRADVQKMHADFVAALAQNASYAQRTAKALERAMPDGDALATRAAT